MKNKIIRLFLAWLILAIVISLCMGLLGWNFENNFWMPFWIGMAISAGSPISTGIMLLCYYLITGENEFKNYLDQMGEK